MIHEYDYDLTVYISYQLRDEAGTGCLVLEKFHEIALFIQKYK